MKPRSLVALALAPAAGLFLTACGDDADPSADGTVTIVASTNVYGAIAEAIAGDLAEVESIISSSAQDPHEYEASAQDRLAIDDADLVIENGGGYDPFIDVLLSDADSSAVVLSAVELSGLLPEDEEHADEEHADEEHADEEHADEEHADEEPGHDSHEHIEGFNEHVWYSFHAVEHLTEEIAHELGEIDPENADTYTENQEAFVAELAALEEQAEALAANASGRAAAMTEPLPVYLLEEVGLEIVTPEDFSEAVEEGADVPPRVLQETLEQFTELDIAVLAYNSQTSDSTTEQVRSAAESAGVPVVDFTETLPEGLAFLEWQRANLDNLTEALG